jgi:hypothetical protein
MNRHVLIALAAGSLTLAPALSASAIPAAHPSALINAENSMIQIRGGHGHGWGHHAGRGHHYGWSRGKGHHYGYHRHW